ncbi:hypothetical protein CHARACLAT_028315 [Characodon lateralis]|uniref:Uncharacterized protein n=1 Tax=Characodon lateralis TaxID=208331 RepID=A0ABU7D5I6_9TELE|nr:hypothetical protein [Characodon lateralis]
MRCIPGHVTDSLPSDWTALTEPARESSSASYSVRKKAVILIGISGKLICSLFSCLTVDHVGTVIRTSVTTATRLKEPENGKKKRTPSRCSRHVGRLAAELLLPRRLHPTLCR